MEAGAADDDVISAVNRHAQQEGRCGRIRGHSWNAMGKRTGIINQVPVRIAEASVDPQSGMRTINSEELVLLGSHRPQLQPSRVDAFSVDT